MAYIYPNSTVIICKGVPLDRSYNHTVYFADSDEQLYRISQYKKGSSYVLNNQSYQRAGKGKIRVAILADNLYDCNYMIFYNTSYGTKPFYAFIDSVEYINDNASEINYTIDVMQTWYFDYTLGSCFVEREHSSSDNIGEHIEPENFEIGEMIPSNKFDFVFPHYSDDLPLYTLVVFYTPNKSKGFITGYSASAKSYIITPCEHTLTVPPIQYYDTTMIVNGIYVGCKMYGIPMTLEPEVIDDTKERIDLLLTTIAGNQVDGTIIGVTQVPYEVWSSWNTSGGRLYNEQIGQFESNRFYDRRKITYYTPKNNKLLTYPYRQIVLSNNTGQTASFRWEQFNDGLQTQSQCHCTFNVQGVPVLSPEVMCYPYNYRGIVNDYENGIILNDFPDCAWNEDTFTRWWSQNRESYITSLLANAVGGGIKTLAYSSSAPSFGVSSAIGTATSIANSVGQISQIINAPPQVRGQVNGSTIRAFQNRVGFSFYDMGVEKELAKTIDDYFSMFGYSVKKVKIPNIKQSGATLRKEWNYIKTNGCVIHSATNKGLPAEDEEKISKIYDNGITFWMDIDNVGDYSLDNSPNVEV